MGSSLGCVLTPATSLSVKAHHTPRLLPNLKEMDFPSPNPRRRQMLNPSVSTRLPRLDSSHDAAVNANGLKYCLRKGSTFHSPTSPRSPDYDPILSVPSLPKRSPTCAKHLEASLAEERIAQLIGKVDRSLSGLEAFSSEGQALPLPRFLVNASTHHEPMIMDSPSPRPERRRHHASDSGIGSTETSEHSVLNAVKQGMKNVCLSWAI